MDDALGSGGAGGRSFGSRLDQQLLAVFAAVARLESTVAELDIHIDRHGHRETADAGS